MKEQGDVERQSQPSAPNPRDGAIDFSSYSQQQLIELQDTLDRQAFPRNFERLLAELERRRAEPASLVGPRPPDGLVSGHFTPDSGLKGWWQALRRRMPLYGPGSVEVKGDEVILQGWRRTWLGVAQQTVLIIATQRVRNVACDGARVRFEHTRRLWRARPVELLTDSPQAAQRVAAALPAAQTPGFEKRWVQLRDFERRVGALQQTCWVTPALVLINTLIFAALALKSARLGGFDLSQLIAWGADAGPFTLRGQPWRLITCLFLHINALHLALNMWALWNVGRLAERLYGPVPYLVLYFGSGLLASTASVTWNLGIVSVGASGAIFGVLGAFLVFFLRRRDELPASLWRAHGLSTLLFVLYNIVNGLFEPLIDMAAHIGGLAGGLALGWLLALPLSPEARRQFPFKEALGALMLSAAASGALLLQVNGLGAAPRPVEQYLSAQQPYAHEAEANLARWQELGAQQAQGLISDGELGRRFEEEILPFWQRTAQRLAKENSALPQAQQPVAQLLSQLAQVRVETASAVIALVRGDSSKTTVLQHNSQRIAVLNARLERLEVRTNMDYQARSLSQSRWALAARRWLPGHRGTCVEEPEWDADGALAPSDSATDGPAARHAAGCRAQRLFLTGDYVTLDAEIRQAAATLNDLPDGSSTLTGIYSGLDLLFSYGPEAVQEFLSHTAAWRRALPASLEPVLVEASVFYDWAWNARGHAGAADVTRQAWALFEYRSEMAAASLEDAQSLAQSNPYWYQLSLNIGLNRSPSVESLRATLDEGAKRFPSYHPLYGSMLRILMPRWLGSVSKVDDLIHDVTHFYSGNPDLALYARLYWTYASLERDQLDIFKEGDARWDLMQSGFMKLLSRYPHSDFLLNGYAKMACMAGDQDTYAQLKPHLAGRLSASAWSRTLTPAACDAKMKTAADGKAADSPPRIAQ